MYIELHAASLSTIDRVSDVKLCNVRLYMDCLSHKPPKHLPMRRCLVLMVLLSISTHHFPPKHTQNLIIAISFYYKLGELKTDEISHEAISLQPTSRKNIMFHYRRRRASSPLSSTLQLVLWCCAHSITALVTSSESSVMVWQLRLG